MDRTILTESQSLPGAAEPDSQPALSGAMIDKRRRRASVVFLMLVIALAAGVMYAKRGPQSAAASTLRLPTSTAGIDGTLDAELPMIRDTDHALSETERFAGRLKLQPASVQVPLMELKKNPFRLGAAGASPTSANDDQTETQHLQQQRQSALQAVQSLQLQMIRGAGAQRECMINGVRYHEGQEADGFLVDEIASSAVVVRKGVYRFELKLVR